MKISLFSRGDLIKTMIYLIKTKLDLIKSPEIRVFCKFFCTIFLLTEVLAIFIIPFVVFPTPILITVIWLIISAEIIIELIYIMKTALLKNSRQSPLINWSVFVTSVFVIFSSLLTTHIDRQFFLQLNIYKIISSAILLSLLYLITLLLFQVKKIQVKNRNHHLTYLVLITLLISFIVIGIVVKPYFEKITVLFLSFGITALYFLVTYYFLKIILQLNEEAKKIGIMTMCTIIFVSVLLATSFIVRSWITDEKLQDILTVVAAEIIGGAFTLVSVIITIRVGHIDNQKTKEELESSKAISERQKSMPLFGIRLLCKKQLSSNLNLCTFKTPKIDDALIAYSLFANSDNSNFKIVSLTIDDKVYELEHTHFVLKSEIFGLAFYLSQCENTNIIMRCKDILNNVYAYQLYFRKTNAEEPFFALYAFEEIK